MGQSLNRLVKRTLQNEYRRQTQKRTGVRKVTRAAVSGGTGNVLIAGQTFPGNLIQAAHGANIAVQNVGRPANAVYTPVQASGPVYVAGIGPGGGTGDGGTGGPTYIAGNGIAIVGVNVIQTKHNTMGGLGADVNGNYIILPALSGLHTDATGLYVGAGDGIDVLANSVAVDVTDIFDPAQGLGEDLSNNLIIKRDTNSGLVFGGTGGLALGTPGDLAYNSTNAVTTTTHTHAITTSSDVSTSHAQVILKSGGSGELGLAQLTLRGNIIFAGGDREIQANAVLSILPAGDLFLNPGGVVLYPDGQTSRTATFNDFVAGIQGFLLDDVAYPANVMRLRLSEIKADQLFVKKFTADEARVQRGETFLTRSFGIVETAFTVPAVGSTVDIWFEEAPGLGTNKLFLKDNWIEFRTIDWGVGLVTQRIWFQIVDADGAGLNDWVAREAQTTTTPARQQWRLIRRFGGFDGAVIAKGEVGADFGQPPHIDGITPVPGQGVVFSSSLYSDDGPFVTVQTFESVISNVPQFKNRVRMGNLKNTVDFLDTTWGFAAGDDLSVVPSMGFSGVAIDKDQGTRLFNTDLKIYEAGTLALELTPEQGLRMMQDDSALGSELRNISWFDVLDVTGVRQSFIDSYLSGGTNNFDINVNAFGGGFHSIMTLLATEDNTGQTASITLNSNNSDSSGSWMVLGADYLQVIGLFGIGISKAIARLHVNENSNLIDQRAGILIQNQGSTGDAVLHWYVSSTGQYYTAGIDHGSGDVFKISAGTSLGASDFIIIDPSTGAVTINGLTGGSAISGLTAGTGIALAGSTISVSSAVVLTSRQVNSGSGLTGGGDLSANRTLAIDLASPSGLSLAGGLNIPDGIAGDGLTFLSKILAVGQGDGITVDADAVAVDATVVRTPATVVRTTRTISTGSGLSGGGDLSANRTLAVDGTVVRTSQSVLTPGGGGLSGGGALAGDLSLTVDSTVVRTSRVVSAGDGLSGGGALSSDISFAVDATVVRTSRTIATSGALAGGGDLSANRSLTLTLGANSALNQTSGLVVDTSIAGAGLTMTAGHVDVIALSTGGLTANANDLQIKLPAVSGLVTDATGLYISPGRGLEIVSNLPRVDEDFAFVWTGAHSWAGASTFNGTFFLNNNLQFQGARTISTDSTNGLLLTPGGSLTLSPASGVILPASSYVTDLGAYNRKFRTMYVAEIYAETLVAQAVMATIGGRVMVAPTNVLVADLTNVATTINVKYNNFVNGSYLFFESAPGGVPQFEAMKVTSAVSGTAGNYTYTVTRNLDGSGANAWVAGDACVDWGSAVGQGYIDLTSTTTALGSHSGPTITVYARNATTNWNDITPTTTMGNLKGFVGYATDQYGFAVGNDLTLPLSSFSGLTADRLNGIRLWNTDLAFYIAGVKSLFVDDNKGITFRYETSTTPNYLLRWNVDPDIDDVFNDSRIYANKTSGNSFFNIQQRNSAGGSNINLWSERIGAGNSGAIFTDTYAEINQVLSGVSTQMHMESGKISVVGDVVIGGTTALGGAPLTIYEGGGVSTMYVVNQLAATYSDAAPSASINLRSRFTGEAGNTDTARIKWGYASTWSASGARFGIDIVSGAGNYVNALTFLANGLVGIGGVSSPQASLHLANVGGAESLLVGGYATYYSQMGIGLSAISNGYGYIQFDAQRAAVAGGVLALQPTAGTVAIGTTAAAFPLVVQVKNTAYSSASTVLALIRRGTSFGGNLDGAGARMDFVSEDHDGNGMTVASIDGVIIDPDYNAGGRRGNLVFSTAPPDFGGVAERMRIDEYGRIGIGTPSPVAIETYSRLTVQASDGAGVYAAVINTGAGQVALSLNRTGTTPQRWVEYIPGGSTDLHLYNSYFGSAALVLTASGLLTPSGGISFGSTAITSYAESTSFTPTFTGSTGAPTVTYVTQTSGYTKQNKTCTVQVNMQGTAISGGSGDLRVNLPFTSWASGVQYMTCYIWPGGLNIAAVLRIGSNVAYGLVQLHNGGTQMTLAAMGSGSFTIGYGGTYMTA